MPDSSTLKTIMLQFLALVGLVLGRIPWVGALVSILTQVVNDNWPEMYALFQKAKAKKLMAASKKDGVDLSKPLDFTQASQELAAMMEDVAAKAGGTAGIGKPLEAGKAAGEADGFRH